MEGWFHTSPPSFPCHGRATFPGQSLHSGCSLHPSSAPVLRTQHCPQVVNAGQHVYSDALRRREVREERVSVVTGRLLGLSQTGRGLAKEVAV